MPQQSFGPGKASPINNEEFGTIDLKLDWNYADSIGTIERILCRSLLE